jgi:O-antigen/teichoic acid export membrane protein
MTATRLSPRFTLVRARRLVFRGRGATSAVGAQLAQAGASVVLSIAAARWLGADGLGVFGLLSGGVTLACAITTGLVGDSLTVLDRSDRRIRAGLQVVGLWCAFLTVVVGTVACGATGLLSWPLSLLFGIGTAAFITEDYLRRLLMANLRFGSVLAVDTSTLVATICWLVVAWAASSVDMLQILMALFVSQLVGMAVAIVLVPRADRYLTGLRRGDGLAVFRYGGWRAAQQTVRPAMLTGMRVLTVIAAGTVAFGTLEAARVYAAPTLLIVAGLAGFLFSTYAAKQDTPVAELVRDADRGAIALSVLVLVAGGIAAVLLPWAGGIVTGSQFSISEAAVFGWVLYSAGQGLVTPYGSLASVSGLHVTVFKLRLVESVVSLVAVVVVLFVFHASPNWVPIAMTIAPCALAVVIRQHVLGRQREVATSTAAERTERNGASSP